MFHLLFFVPVLTSLILGGIYLFDGSGRPILKFGGTATFVAAVYLQFFSGSSLVGMLLQTALAFSLAVWRRLDGLR